MIKRIYHFSNPAHLYLRKAQLCISFSKSSETDNLEDVITKPIEDIGAIVLEHRQITITHALLDALMQNNVAVITCDETFHPSGMLMPLAVNTLQSERFRSQIDCSEPLKKNLWTQTVTAKLKNQSLLLKYREKDYGFIEKFAKSVNSGDPDNLEARGAAIYWQNLFDAQMKFKRDRFGDPPNNILNYGYSILRACTARSLLASGLLPTLGIHHHSRYNAFCLADDIMEPYRPFVDRIVCKIMAEFPDYTELTKDIKAVLLSIPVLDVEIEKERCPLMIALQRTTASLAKCYEGSTRKLIYPLLV
jgi:CRISPR-associated protein Cas1